MMVAHTPLNFDGGPWITEEQWYGTAIKTADETRTIARVNQRSNVSREWGNAFLIAAAPDLHSAAGLALELVMKVLDGREVLPHEYGDLEHALNKALRKAEGR